MSWFPVDDGAHSHPKMRRAGLEAVGLWTVSGSFCMAYLTDGFVPEWFVKEKPRGMALAKRLIDAGLWTVGDCNGEKGWWFHDWKPECTKARIEEARESARIRKQKSRDKSGDKPPPSRVTETVTGRVTDGGRDAGVLGYPAQPSPAQEKDLSGYHPESATEPNARDSIAATPGAELVREIIPAGHPPAVLTQLRIRASELIKQGTPRHDVAAALELWLTKPSLGPNALPSLVSEAVKARAAPASRPHKMRVLAELAQETAAAETRNRKELPA